MTDEEINRKFDIVAGHLATLAVKLDKLAEKTDSLADAQHRAEDRWVRTEESVRALLVISEVHEREIMKLAESQARTDKQMAETNERLNALINTVERYISERRNGGNDVKSSE